MHKVLETAEAEIADLREDLDQAHWELEECRRDTELNASRAKESAREEMKDRHLKEMSMKDEIISLLKEKLATERKNAGLSLGGGSSASESVEGDKEPPKVAEERTAKKMTLPTLQKFGGDGDAFDRWLRKFSHYAELEQWTERQKLLQLELYLSGRAEQVYEVLPASAKDTFPRAVESLKMRLQPDANKALLSSQLMKRKQRAGESVSTYAQELEVLFEKSYGKRQGMDLASKEVYSKGICSSRDYPLSGRRKSCPPLPLLQMHFTRSELPKSRTHCWGNYTVGAPQISHQISHHLPDPLPRIEVSEEEIRRGDWT